MENNNQKYKSITRSDVCRKAQSQPDPPNAMWQSPYSVEGIPGCAGLLSRAPPGLQELRDIQNCRALLQRDHFCDVQELFPSPQGASNGPLLQLRSTHSSAGGSFSSSGHLGCKDLQVPPAPSSPEDLRHLQDLTPGLDVTPPRRDPDDGAVLREGFTSPRGITSASRDSSTAASPMRFESCRFAAFAQQTDFAFTCKSKIQRFEQELNL